MSHLAYVLFASGAARRPERTEPSFEAGVEAFLAAAVARGRSAHPAISSDAEDFVAHLARHVPEEPFAPDGAPHEGTRALAVTDLYLAAACLRGDRAAIDVLHREHLSQVPLFVARVMRGVDKTQVDDLVQALAEKMLVPKGERAPRLAEYGGQGPLGGWIRVVSTRMALKIVKKAGDDPDAANAREAPDVPVGKEPELDHLRVNYKDKFKLAFEGAFQRLDKEQRLLLRLHSSGTLRGEDIAKMLGIDRSTAMRKLARAREVLFDATRDGLMADAGISSNEFRSIARAVQSQIDVTLSRVLATQK